VASLSERISHSLAEHRLLPRGARVVVAVSGGVDSMVLLQLLYDLAPHHGWELSVAHFNHRLRGRASAADERFVRAIARRLKLACDVGAANVRQAAREQGSSVEMAARQLRHAFLSRSAKLRGARYVALAHHADDQAELFLLRLLRGAGGEGLGGMKRRGPSPVDHRVTLVRPLLDFSRTEISAFAREVRIRFREDASNASTEHERNWVRLELLPQLRRRQPAVDRTIARTMQIAGAEAEFVTQEAAAWLRTLPLAGPHPARPFAQLHPAVQRRVLQMQLRKFSLEPDWFLVEALRGRPNAVVSAGTGLNLERDAAGRVQRHAALPDEFERGEALIQLPSGATSRVQAGELRFAGLRVRWRLRRHVAKDIPSRQSGREFFDADQVGAQLRLRHWQPGDRFQPIGLPAPTKLQDWFTNRKISAARRRQLVLAETGTGDIFWVEDERISESCKVTSATRRLLEWRWKRVPC
jgi:tRNA(Ile)-lysidine synthase